MMNGLPNAEPNFNDGYMVHWQARVLVGPGDIRHGLVNLIRKGGVNVEFEHALPLGKEIGLEFFVNYDNKRHRIRMKGRVTYCQLLANNAGATLSLKTSMIGRQENHTLNNILHTMGTSREFNLKI